MKKYIFLLIFSFLPSMAFAGLTVNGLSVKANMGVGYSGCGEPIMFIGDSITLADGYRKELFLLYGSCPFDAVGTLHSGNTFDSDHEGVSGDTTSLIVARMTQASFDHWYSKSVNNGKVFIHMGTNNTSAYTTNKNNLITLLDRIDQTSVNKNNGLITVYVALIIPNNGGSDATTVTLNSNYTTALNAYSATSIRIVEVDMHTAFTADTYGFCSGDWSANCMGDTLHPSSNGYKTMANQLKDCIDNPSATNCRAVNFTPTSSNILNEDTTPILNEDGSNILTEV